MTRACLIALTIALTETSACAQDARIGAADEFESLGEWAANNPKAPAELECDGERLILTDLPGGEVTWGTSCYRTFTDVDVGTYRYLIARVDEMTDAFAAKVINRDTGEKIPVLRGLREPGLIVEDLAKRTGWDGVIDISLGLYASGDGSRIAVDYVRFASSLTPEEQAALREVRTVEVIPLSGLDQLGARSASRPLPDEPPHPSERFIYMDPVTHAWVWRMTDHPGVERHEYYDIPAWNADGKLMILMTRRGDGRYWLMNADGSDIRPFPEPADGGDFSTPRWMYHDPDRVFIYRSDEERTTVLTMNVYTGEVDEVVTIPVGSLSMEPPHPDDAHFLFHRDREHLWVVDGDTGQYTTFTLWPTHRRRFTRAPDHSLFINRNQDPDEPDVRRRTSWTCRRDGSELTLLEDQGGGHPDFSPDGGTLAYYASGGIWLVDRDGTNRRMLLDTSGGHGGFSLDGRWHVSDAPHGGPYREQVYVTEIATGRVHPICFHHSSYSGWGSGVPDPEATHPAPISSPDCTKIVYDSDMMGQPDMWVAVWRFPDRPENLRVERDGGDVLLTWQRPKRSAELAGYNVYRRPAGEGQFTRIASLLDEPRHVDVDAGEGPWDYAVSCREHSDLESPLAIHWGGDRQVVALEAEGLDVPDEAEIVVDQRVGDGFYVSAGGRQPMTVALPTGDIADEVTVWARLRDPGASGAPWSVAVGDERVEGPAAGAQWAWRRIDAPRAIADDARLTLTLGTGLQVDQIQLADDADLAPAGIVGRPGVALNAPAKLTVEAAEATRVDLSWQQVDGAHHYRIYATRDPELERGNATLVGTPTEPRFADCGLVPASVYRYQVTAADIRGAESEPTAVVEAETPTRQWSYLHLGAEHAELQAPMAFVAGEGLSSAGYVHVPDDYSDEQYVHEGSAALTFKVPVEGEYFIWGRAMGLDGKSDSFLVSVDGGERHRWDLRRGGDEPAWTWQPVAGLTPVHLTAGEHVLRVHSREDGARLDTLIVTDDPFFEPVGLQPEFERAELVYANDFADEASMEGWRLEGAVRHRIEDGLLLLEAFDEGATKGVAWCPETFEDPVEITWRYRPLTPHGLSIIFFMAEGREGEDIFSWERDGSFDQYIKGRMNAYHISYHRHFTDRCNVRKNFGFHLVAETVDPCRATDHEYQISVRKFGPHIQFLVDGRLVHNWYDDGIVGGPTHDRGKIGFRHTRRLQALYDDLRVYRLTRR